MIERFVKNIFTSKDFSKQMRFLAGPRRSGKTFIAKHFLNTVNCENLYYNWDIKNIRQKYIKDQDFYLNDINRGKKNIWICFDEIHKVKKWKNILKEHFDKNEDKNIKTIVTGSARLDLFRKAGDSLAGRYFLFHLYPLILSEVSKRKSIVNDLNLTAEDFIKKWLERDSNQDEFETLFKFSGFPEPLISGKETFHNKWKDDYIEKLIYEDLREISQIKDLDKIAELILTLPSKVGSLLSINSLKEDLEISFETVKNHLRALELIYVLFFIKPYTKKISRTIKKESKVYFFDWTRVNSPGVRFENYVACELKALVTLWSDAGYGKADIFFVRTKDGKESDFLIIKDNKPWILFEVKLSSQEIENHHFNLVKNLGNIPIVQIVLEKNLLKKISDRAFIVSADRFF
ncbi:MAG: ATP-binding protein [Candidatus Melainabacteria bacterium]|nr:ATP-binding protein [Candidatus Melainabacteria bacterium]